MEHMHDIGAARAFMLDFEIGRHALFLGFAQQNLIATDYPGLLEFFDPLGNGATGKVYLLSNTGDTLACILAQVVDDGSIKLIQLGLR